MLFKINEKTETVFKFEINDMKSNYFFHLSLIMTLNSLLVYDQILIIFYSQE